MIEFRGVYKKYGNGTEALQDVNIRIDDGEFVFIVGASGAGKSTFLKLIMHEETATAGEVIVNNYKFSRLKRRAFRICAARWGWCFRTSVSSTP